MELGKPLQNPTSRHRGRSEEGSALRVASYILIIALMKIGLAALAGDCLYR